MSLKRKTTDKLGLIKNKNFPLKNTVKPETARKYLQNLYLIKDSGKGCEELSGGLGPYPSKSQGPGGDPWGQPQPLHL